MFPDMDNRIEESKKSGKVAELTYMPKVWGAEFWFANNAGYCGKVLSLKKGHRCSFHSHKKKEETFLVVQGKVLMENDENTWVMLPGAVQHIPHGLVHRFTGLEDSVIIEASTTHYEDDSYRKTQSEKIPEEEFNALMRKYGKEE